MTHLIDVSTVLRGTVCDLYSNLVTRPTGAAVRTAIERQVVDIGAPVVTTIDFSQVNLLDFSCADEIVAKLLLRYAAADGPSGYLLFRGINGGHLDPIETVLERHELALVAWEGGRAELFGCVTRPAMSRLMRPASPRLAFSASISSVRSRTVAVSSIALRRAASSVGSVRRHSQCSASSTLGT